jgi:hypothetical protein
VNCSEIHRPRFAIICIDNCNPGVTERSVDREHAHDRQLKIARRAFNPESFPGQHGIDKFQSNRFTRGIVARNLRQIAPFRRDQINFVAAIALLVMSIANIPSAMATTKGLSQIVTPDLQGEGDLSLSLQIQDKRIANPYELQAELGLTKWAEVAVFRGFQPDEWIFGTEIGLLTKEPYLLSVGFVNWSPHLNVDPQPYIEAGYYTEHHKVIVGAIHAGYKNEAILGYAYDFNERWRVQVDFQSGSENSSTIGFTCNVTRDFQFNPALYVNNGPKHDLFGYIVFTYTFHVWGKKDTAAVTKSAEHVVGKK